MQTVLSIRSETAGAVYVNGRLAGEVDPDHSVTLPVSPFGALILEHRPFSTGFLPLTLRIPISQGAPLVASLPDARLFAALWPDGLIELELRPERPPDTHPTRFLGYAGETRVSVSSSFVFCESSSGFFSYPLPDGASPPSMTALPSGALLCGALADSAQYALVLAPDGASCPLSLTGQSVSLLESGAVRVVRLLEDVVGRALLETWVCDRSNWRCAASEPVWGSGAPTWPTTPESTAIAALEAAQLGYSTEAAAYFSPLCPCDDLLKVAATYDGCTPLRVPLLSGEPAVGLTRLEGGLLRIIPAIYRASPGGPHGWQLDSMRIADETSP